MFEDIRTNDQVAHAPTLKRAVLDSSLPDVVIASPDDGRCMGGGLHPYECLRSPVSKFIAPLPCAASDVENNARDGRHEIQQIDVHLLPVDFVALPGQRATRILGHLPTTFP